MVCTTIQVIDLKPVISDLIVTPSQTVQGDVAVEWTQDKAGNVTIQVDSNTPQPISIGIGGAQYVMLHNVSAGTHTICVTAV